MYPFPYLGYGWDIVVAITSLNRNVNGNALFSNINDMDKYVDNQNNKNNINTISTNIIQKENKDNDEKENQYSRPYTNHTMEQNIIGFSKTIITHDAYKDYKFFSLSYGKEDIPMNGIDLAHVFLKFDKYVIKIILNV